MKTANSYRVIGHAFEVLQPSISSHIQIARVDHWFKNVFAIPGIVTALGIAPTAELSGLLGRIAVGLLSLCIVASSNYVINEVMDAPFDRQHPRKCNRPVASGSVNISLAYVEWLALMIAGVSLGFTVSLPFTMTLLALWVMG